MRRNQVEIDTCEGFEVFDPYEVIILVQLGNGEWVTALAFEDGRLYNYAQLYRSWLGLIEQGE